MKTTTDNVYIQKTDKKGFRSLTSLELGQMEIFALSYALGARTNGIIYFLLCPWCRDNGNIYFMILFVQLLLRLEGRWEGGRNK